MIGSYAPQLAPAIWFTSLIDWIFDASVTAEDISEYTHTHKRTERLDRVVENYITLWMEAAHEREFAAAPRRFKLI